jgi:lipopolysaccharide export system protein LptC
MKPHRNIRNILAGGMVLLSVALAVVIFLRYQSAAPPARVETPVPQADLSLKKIQYTETRDGTPAWNLQADSAAHELGDGITRIENVRMVFFGQGSADDLQLTAKHGEWQAATGQLKVMDQVVVSSPKGYTCYTDDLTYSEQKREMSTDGPVRLVSKDLEMTGTGMKFDVVRRTVHLLANVWTRWEGAVGSMVRG